MYDAGSNTAATTCAVMLPVGGSKCEEEKGWDSSAVTNFLLSPFLLLLLLLPRIPEDEKKAVVEWWNGYLIGFLNNLSKYPPLPSHAFAMLKMV